MRDPFLTVYSGLIFFSFNFLIHSHTLYSSFKTAVSWPLRFMCNFFPEHAVKCFLTEVEIKFMHEIGC